MSSHNRTYIVLLGVPGAGKGTQARLLSESLGVPQVSTGDIFRYNLKNETELGLMAKEYMSKGLLVPDSVTIKMVQDRLQQEDAKGGAILDGFPRNLIQAEAFDNMVAPYGGIDAAPLIELEDEDAIKRVTGRRVCRTCGAVYHVDFNPPKAEGICDVDGGELYQRDDDKLETVKERLFVYYKQTSPLIGYYFAKKLLTAIDGTQSIEEVQQKLSSSILE